MIKYRIVTRMVVDGEEFNPQYQTVNRGWEDLKNARLHTWYKTETEARLAIANHKCINGYVPRIIEVE